MSEDATGRRRPSAGAALVGLFLGALIPSWVANLTTDGLRANPWAWVVSGLAAIVLWFTLPGKFFSSPSPAGRALGFLLLLAYAILAPILFAKQSLVPTLIAVTLLWAGCSTLLWRSLGKQSRRSQIRILLGSATVLGGVGGLVASEDRSLPGGLFFIAVGLALILRPSRGEQAGGGRHRSSSHMLALVAVPGLAVGLAAGGGFSKFLNGEPLVGASGVLIGLGGLILSMAQQRILNQMGDPGITARLVQGGWGILAAGSILLGLTYSWRDSPVMGLALILLGAVLLAVPSSLLPHNRKGSTSAWANKFRTWWLSKDDSQEGDGESSGGSS